ncbi:MAG: flagellar hook-basal body protein [Planctomycetes bacterium]|nr:flagellar hook-basal body protein [Planctomycetota bacterium]
MSSYGLWLSAAGMKVNDLRQTIHANNLANAQTTGFKQDLAVVRQRRVASEETPGGMSFAHPVLDGLAGGVNVRPVYHSFTPGPIEHTGKPLDVALQGKGFFAVSDGKVTRYTRDGEFARSRAGELVLAAGDGRWKVLAEGGAPIVLSETGGAVSISAGGDVRQGALAAGKLAVFAAADEQGLRKTGENLFDAGEVEMTPLEARLIPEAREESNYDVMTGLATMIEASRAYQMNATMIQLQDQATGEAVTRVGRVG